MPDENIIRENDTHNIDGVCVCNVSAIPISEQEVREYIKYIQKKYNKNISSLTVSIDGDEIDLHFYFAAVPFERIRRITGYLVGDTSTWNGAKAAELQDRVTHDATMEVI